ncbi:MAG: bifunctional oligoribonuclease/PAP phosphatase NrnA [Bdellovibrionota bacterium]
MDHANFLEQCKKASSLVLTAPAGADGDSVGTQCAFYEIFKSLFPEKEILIVNEDPCPHRYQFLPFTEYFKTSEDLSKEGWAQKEHNDLWICVDGGPNRLGDKTTVFWKNAKARGQVDHHKVSQSFELDFKLNNPDAASTTEIVYEFCQHHRIALTSTLAQSLYVGLIYDTGLFKHSNTNPKVMRIGAHLLESGFNHTRAAEKVLMIRTESNIKLAQKILSHMHFEQEGRYVWATLTQKDFQDAGAKLEDREGLIDLLFLTENCEVASLSSEVEKDKWKVSFRARRLDVASVAKSLDKDGGGHRLAAGCSISGNEAALSAAHSAVKALIEKAEWI